MRPVLVTGVRGTLGSAVIRACKVRGLAAIGTRRDELDIAEDASVGRALDRWEPWLVVNAAGYVRVDDAEGEPVACRRENALGPDVLARRCARAAIPLITFSSDLVFDGEKGSAYDEHDAPMPLCEYGRSKLEGELRVLAAHPQALVIRTSAFFGPWDVHNFVTWAVTELAAGRSIRVANDVTVSPTYVPDLVHACLDLAVDGEHGLWHLANRGALTWADLARAATAHLGVPVDRIVAVPSRTLGWRARRPPHSALSSRRGALLPTLDSALARYHTARAEAWA